MSTGYGWEGIRQVCATLLGARHVPERLCSRPCPQRGAIASARPYFTLPYITTFTPIFRYLSLAFGILIILSFTKLPQTTRSGASLSKLFKKTSGGRAQSRPAGGSLQLLQTLPRNWILEYGCRVWVGPPVTTEDLRKGEREGRRNGKRRERGGDIKIYDLITKRNWNLTDTGHA